MIRPTSHDYERGGVSFTDPTTVEPVSIGLFDNEALGAKRKFELPEGFYAADARTITPVEWVSVLNSVRPYPIPPEKCIEEVENRYEGEKYIGIGVRDEHTRQLVGFGRLAFLGHQGVLLDFAVRPEAQRKGIGRAVLWKRIYEAERLGITELRTDLATTNTLAHRYDYFGFRRVSPSPVLVRLTKQPVTLGNSPFYEASQMLI